VIRYVYWFLTAESEVFDCRSSLPDQPNVVGQLASARYNRDRSEIAMDLVDLMVEKKQDIKRTCARYGATAVRVFGSCARLYRSSL